MRGLSGLGRGRSSTSVFSDESEGELCFFLWCFAPTLCAAIALFPKETLMKKALALIAVVLSLGLAVAGDAQAKRLGGARSRGMQRQQTTQPAAPQNARGAPAQAAPAAGTGAGATAAAAAPAKR